VSVVDSPGWLDRVVVTWAVARSPVTRISVTEVATVPYSLMSLRSISLVGGFLPRAALQDNVSSPAASALFWSAVTAWTSALTWSASDFANTYLYANKPPTANTAIAATTAVTTIGIRDRRGRPAPGG